MSELGTGPDTPDPPRVVLEAEAARLSAATYGPDPVAEATARGRGARGRPADPALAAEVEACRERFDAAAAVADEARRRRREIERTLPPRVVEATHAARCRGAAT